MQSGTLLSDPETYWLHQLEEAEDTGMLCQHESALPSKVGLGPRSR